MWAVRDPGLGAISTARRLPPLLRCQARYAGDPVCAEPGDAPEVVITFPDGEEAPSSDPRVHARLSDLVGREGRLARQRRGCALISVWRITNRSRIYRCSRSKSWPNSPAT